MSVGGDATLECQATGVPSPLVHWFKGKLGILHYTKIRVGICPCWRHNRLFFLLVFPGELEVGSAPFVEQDVHRGTLLIRGVQEVDAGQYSCVASSSAGSSAGTVTLEVGGKTTLECSSRSVFFLQICTQKKSHLQPPFHSTAGPLFSEAPVDVAANVGENITLPCVARGFPQPTVTWHRQDGRQIHTRTDSQSRTMQLENGHLLIQSELSRRTVTAQRFGLQCRANTP